MLELTPRRASLEDLFFRLTEGEGATAHRRPVADRALETA